MVAFLYEQELRELVANVDDESAELWNAIGVDVAEHALLLEASKERRKETLEKIVARSRKAAALARARTIRLVAKPNADAIAKSM